MVAVQMFVICLGVSGRSWGFLGLLNAGFTKV